MQKMISPKQDVEEFIEKMLAILNKESFSVDRDLTINPSEKNDETMVELDYDTEDVAKELRSLVVENYSETKFDSAFEYVTYLYVFGKIVQGKLIYIKVKIRSRINNKNILCLSFHEAKYKMEFPYS